ncbi:MAG: hypothetical protein JRH20_03220 [Deltaproteobacteria bacterium]|nr:hypothetical protein [Deltaproteobacteria bacterium]
MLHGTLRSMLLMGLLMTLMSAPRLAQAKVKLCLDVRADTELSGLTKLLRAQLLHHPSHLAVDKGCDSYLMVQLFSLAKAHYLTLRINQEVPLRFSLKNLQADLEQKLKEALRRVLKRDPVYLGRDIREYSRLERAMRSVLVRGHTRFRFEIFEVLARSGAGASFASAAGFSLTRGSERWRVFARVFGGGAVDGTPREGQVLRVVAGGEAGLTYEFFLRETWSPYLSASLGGQLLHFEGYASSGAGDVETNTDRGAFFGLRAGVRLFRAHDFDFDVFVAASVPFFLTQDPDSLLPGAYTPQMQVGVGVGF